MLVFSTIPLAYAAETDGGISTEPTEITTTQQEETTPTETEAAEATQPEETEPTEETQGESVADEELSLALMSLDDGIATLAETEIVGQPNAFGNLFLINGGIDIPSFGQIQHKEHLPLYSVYLKNQPGYENNYYVAYCIEPGIFLGESGGHSGSSSTVGGMTDGTGALHYLTRAQVEAMGVVLLYGQKEIARRADEESYRMEKLCRHAATQAIIWEIAAGWRSATPPYTRYDSTLYDAITPRLECAVQVWDSKFYLDGMDDAYDELAAQIESHYTIPSFMSSTQSTAPSYEMTRNSNGTYSITLTDSNYVLSQYSFSSTSSLTFSVSGNRLTITSSTPFTGKTIVATKQVPDLDSQVFYIWEHEEQQKLMSCKTDPTTGSVPAYLSLTAPDLTCTLNIAKSTEDGKNLSGWRFGVYSDSACTNLIAGPVSSNANGAISISGLTAQTVYVKELGHSTSSINDLYYCASANPQRVTLTAGGTTTVRFNNKLTTGQAQLIKNTNTGENLSGWQIGVYTDSGCTQAISGSPFTTGQDGTVNITLAPGTYYAKELPTGDSYWECDSSVKTIIVKANETVTATFTNTHFGRIEFRKTTNTGNHLEGWVFRVRDADGKTVGEYTTDSSGYAVTGNLPLGRYTVVELPTEDDYWQVELGFHDVTVRGGETTVDAWNNVEQGLVWFYKETNTQGTTQGWQVSIYADENCTQKLHTLEIGELEKAGYYIAPGIYYARESGDSQGRFNSEYWTVDNTVHRFEIKPHEDVELTFRNTEYGKLKISKTTKPSGSAEGWQFTVTDADGKEVEGSPFTMTASGEIVTGKLLPGTYTVEELIPDGSLYFCESENPQTVTVTASQTAQVSFVNCLKSGSISIHKVNSHNEPLAGAAFLLEWSEDKTNWEAVHYAKDGHEKGGSTTAALKDGYLTSGTDGNLLWDGLYPGLYYRVTEIAAPEGYELLKDYAFEGQLPNEELTVELRVVNGKGFVLPETGSNAAQLLHYAQLLTMSACAVLLLLSHRKKEW